jgi:hypothetical protein
MSKIDTKTTIERLKQVRELIAHEPFDYSSVNLPGCGTPGCIAGWLCHLAIMSGDVTRPDGSYCVQISGYTNDPLEAGAIWAGLDGELAEALFYGEKHEGAGLGCLNNLSKVSPVEAQERIDKVIAYLDMQDQPDAIRALAQEALSLQDASNLLGLSKRFPKAIQELADALRSSWAYTGTDSISRHPITQAWTSKLSSLSGECNFHQVELIAEGVD